MTYVCRRVIQGLTGAICLAVVGLQAAAPATVRLVGDWDLEIAVQLPATEPGAQPRTIVARAAIPPPQLVTVTAEEHATLPPFNPNTGGWIKGAALFGVKAQECTTPNLLEPESLEVRAGPEPSSPRFGRGKDYEADLAWATIGRIPGGQISEKQPVYIRYRHGLLRIDAIVLTADEKITVRKGTARAAAPPIPALLPGERLLATVWLPGRVTKLQPDNVFPVLETAYPEPAKAEPSPAEQLLPKTMQKLRGHEPLRILAWGDSVTDGSYLPERDRWQAQFVARLRQRFPEARIELVTEAWGGRNTASYLAEPKGSVHNYAEKVLSSGCDLIVSEFVNDAGLTPAQVEERYSRLLADFKKAGAEWIILTPHYVRPDWMGLNRERDIDDDPRPYVAGLRQFAARHDVALADAARRYGRLWRQGIPYSSLMVNSINHPDARGMSIFADSLMALFP